MHEVDEIVVIKNGVIIEHGTFKQLMNNKGHLSQLIGEHVQIIEENEAEQEPEQIIKVTNNNIYQYVNCKYKAETSNTSLLLKS